MYLPPVSAHAEEIARASSAPPPWPPITPTWFHSRSPSFMEDDSRRLYPATHVRDFLKLRLMGSPTHVAWSVGNFLAPDIVAHVHCCVHCWPATNPRSFIDRSALCVLLRNPVASPEPGRQDFDARSPKPLQSLLVRHEPHPLHRLAGRRAAPGVRQ